MSSKGFAQIALVLTITMSLASNPIILSKSDKETDSITMLLNYIKTLPGRIAFAESGNGESATGDQNKTEAASATTTDQQPKDEKQPDKVEGETQADKQVGKEDVQLEDQNKTEGGHQPEANQEGIDEIENENNNEKATHEENEQIVNDIDDAKKNETIAAEVDVNDENVGTQSLDNNVSVKTEHPTNDTVNITVNASSQTGPKVLLINLNSTTIDVANMKSIDVRYDGKHITPAANVDEVLHPASSDQPHYAILVTQSGAQILVSIPHFSTHTITVSKINKVMPSIVPEFPIALLVMLIAVASTVAFYRIKSPKI